MKHISLNGLWKLSGNGYECNGTIPGSVYSVLLENKLMDDPYYRENEIKALQIAEHDYTFIRSFSLDEYDEFALLCCDGLDTLCDIYLNGCLIGQTKNMHRRYEFEISKLLQHENELKLVFHSANRYFKKKYVKRVWDGDNRDSLLGYSYLRKSFCMSGWDWGPRLPDAGIWKDIYLLVGDTDRIQDIRITQRHENGQVWITPTVSTKKSTAKIQVILTSPSGEKIEISANSENEISNPKLWWPNGLGEQNLYNLSFFLYEDDMVVDSASKNVGLRTMRLVREKDEYGESFCHEVNGVRFFAKGADYIPEDCILSRITPERTEKLLTNCRNSNFNAIRVWGGGNYPKDDFYDACDKLGIVVFNDLMIAGTLFPINDELTEEFTEEIRDNLMRIRHHACIALICGNNECEWHQRNFPADYKNEYLSLYENKITNIINEICHEIPYIPSSPTSFEEFNDPNNENKGDSHFWEVWLGNKPFFEYRNHYFRYLSEFGFESLPSKKTIDSFTLPSDRNIFSRVMEMHQRSNDGNQRIISYISKTFLYPTNFETLIYASQLLQARAMQYAVEHLRRNRGRCMGALYWQLNDVWPTASWSSIDYFGRFKALQYVAKRFFEPIIISCCETGETTTRPFVTMENEVYDYETKAILSVTNDTLNLSNGTVKWRLCRNDGTVLKCGEKSIEVPPLSVVQLEEFDFNKTDIARNYLWYEYSDSDYSGSVIFTEPKHFEFLNPELSVEIKGNIILVTAKSYAQQVEIYSPDEDFILSDNFFDMEPGTRKVTVLEGEPEKVFARSVFDIR